jgi:hypothetical protein
MYAQRYGFDPGAYEEGTDEWNGKLDPNALPYEELQHHDTFYDGAHMTIVQQNPVLEVELPHQSLLRFYPAKRENIVANNAYSDFHVVRKLERQTEAGGDILYDFVAAAEDFSLQLFTGCPIVYFIPSDPAPIEPAGPPN